MDRSTPPGGVLERQPPRPRPPSEDPSVPWDESGTPSPDDTGGPQGQTLTWVSGGCTSGVPAASAFVLGLWLLLRRRR